MNDRDIMENLLLTTKGVCDLFMHGAIESSTDNVHQTFCTALGNSLSMQDSIYKEMSSHGWYSSEQAQQQRIDQVKQKFSAPQAYADRRHLPAVYITLSYHCFLILPGLTRNALVKALWNAE